MQQDLGIDLISPANPQNYDPLALQIKDDTMTTDSVAVFAKLFAHKPLGIFKRASFVEL